MAKTAELLPESNGSIFRPWRELAILAFIGMELSWVTVFYSILFPAEKAIPYGRALGILFGMLLFSYILTELTGILNLKESLRWGLLGAVFFIFELIGIRLLIRASSFKFNLAEFLNRPANTLNNLNNLIPAEFLLLVLVFWIWWRGISLVSKQTGPQSMIAGFRTGVAAFFVYGLSLPLVSRVPLIPALAVFVFSSLVAMSAARISVLAQMRGGQRIPMNRYWLAGILVIVTTVTGLAILAAEIMRLRIFNLVTLIYSWILYLIVIVLSPLLLLILQLIFQVGKMINLSAIFSSLLNFLFTLQENLQKLFKSLGSALGEQNLAGLLRFFQITFSLRYLVFWLGILLAVIMVLITLQRRIWKRDTSSEQQTEDILKSEDLLELIRSALRRGLSRAAASVGGALRLRQAGNLFVAARIRRIYARLLWLSAQLGQERPAACTPLEFLPKLEQIFPNQQAELGTITRAYLQVRYGERSESKTELESVEKAWKHVSAEAKLQLTRRNRKRNPA